MKIRLETNIMGGVMRKTVVACALFSLLMNSAAESKVQKTQPTSGGLTGHYALKYSNVSDRLAVQQSKSDEIKFELVALLTGTDSPRNGEVRGTAKLHNNIALYDDGAGCSVKFVFSNGKAKVSVPDCDACGFGAYVTADGDFKKLDARPPKFDF
jgi:hypothetical protein